MSRTVIVDCFPESASRYREGYAVVAIDVVRATTTAITAAALGYRCFPVASAGAALTLAGRLDNPLLAGEQCGIMPSGFEINNSPAALAGRTDRHRPVVLVSSSGTRLCEAVSQCEAAFLACLRNYTAAARHLAHRFRRIAVIGAGTRDEFREEDQMCCAWIAGLLLDAGYEPKDDMTARIVERWRGAQANKWTDGNSAGYLRRSGQIGDLHFILSHVDDLQAAFSLRNGEVLMEPVTRANADNGIEVTYV
jgi:2-phosphosulfolactate phosphatase